MMEFFLKILLKVEISIKHWCFKRPCHELRQARCIQILLPLILIFFPASIELENNAHGNRDETETIHWKIQRHQNMTFKSTRSTFVYFFCYHKCENDFNYISYVGLFPWCLINRWTHVDGVISFRNSWALNICTMIASKNVSKSNL